MRLSHHRHPSLATTQRTRREGGYVLVTFGLMLIPLLLMAGLAVDVGSWYSKASDMQKAADAAALAGVVWLPDETKARQVALDVAKRNGYDDADPDISVTVSPSTKSPRRLKVVITDGKVGSYFFESLGGHDIKITRRSFAEYVMPVPLGSPRNYFGTGKLVTADPELLYQSVNPYCTDKVQGDRHQSRWFGGTCAGTSNTDYKTTGYELYIDAVAGRPASIDVRIYDGRYSTADLSYQQAGTPVCTPVYTYPSDTTTGWTLVTTNTTINGPKQYQTRNNANTNTWSAVLTLTPGQSSALTANRGRWRSPVVTQSCTTPYTTVADNHIDMTLGSANSERFTYSLYYADDTPNDDSDNVLKCSKQFDAGTAFDNYVFLGSMRWNSLCSIATTDPSGKYILRVQNNGANGNTASGANQYGVVARYTNAIGDGLCDGRTDALCPRVYGKDAISVYANNAASTASFFLAQIGQEHAGAKLRLELWDPGEGGDNIQIMKPTGANSWAAVPFSYKVGTATPVTTTSLNVTNSVFNGKLVEITVDLEGYVAPAGNDWWKIKYAFSSGTVTDRTTWSARIVGDPIHILEEN